MENLIYGDAWENSKYGTRGNIVEDYTELISQSGRINLHEYDKKHFLGVVFIGLKINRITPEFTTQITQESKLPKPTPETERDFHSLSLKWKDETRKFGTMIHKVNDTYIDIMMLGPEIIPLILIELKKKPDHWFVALKHLTRKMGEQNPVPVEHLGDIEKMREDWIRWGERIGYKI